LKKNLTIQLVRTLLLDSWPLGIILSHGKECLSGALKVMCCVCFVEVELKEGTTWFFNMVSAERVWLANLRKYMISKLLYEWDDIVESGV
jgi:hypothetical protein